MKEKNCGSCIGEKNVKAITIDICNTITHLIQSLLNINDILREQRADSVKPTLSSNVWNSQGSLKKPMGCTALAKFK